MARTAQMSKEKQQSIITAVAKTIKGYDKN
jgi:hypothetical protein